MSVWNEQQSAGDREPAPLEIRLFGDWETRTHGRPIPSLRSRKERWLLALLALRTGTETRRETLAVTLWPDAAEEGAMGYLRRSLMDLRRALGSEVGRIVSPSPRTLRLDLSGAFCDVLAFDQALRAADAAPDPLPLLEQAVAFYRGPLLPDCYEEWLLAERTRREIAHQDALERLAGHLLGRAEPAAASRWLRLLLVADPYRESAARSLMQALSDSGDRAAVRQVYQELRLRLHNDLHAAPAPETQALFDRLSRRAMTAHSPASDPAPPSLRRLPVPLTDLIGRERDVEEVTGWLKRSRLVTLLGPGGVGKTRLAIAAAESALPGYADGVWFVDLAPLRDPSRLADTVARALGVPDEPGRSPEEGLLAALASRSMLLVLDNCEHLQDAVAEQAFRLLSACPGLRILATSRHTLGVTGEQVYLVPSLALPPSEVARAADSPRAAEKDPAWLLEYEGVRLFVQRAIQSNPSFRLDRRNGAMIAEICRRLDGIPLALEMAAARLRSLSVADVNARLTDRFRLLTTGNRGALPRQQTLRAALDWSFELLKEEEKSFFHRLSVFVGGFTEEGAAAVGGRKEGDAGLERLVSLTEQSLLEFDPGARPPRYRMLETMREYGLARLNERGETGEARHRHRDYLLELAGRATRQWESDKDRSYFSRIDQEYPNIQAALAYGLESDDAARGLALLKALDAYWLYEGSMGDGRRHWEDFLTQREACLSPEDCLRVCYHCGHLAYCQSDYESALKYGKRALEMARERGDRERYAEALNLIATVYDERHEYELGRPYFEERLAVWGELGLHEREVGARLRLNEVLGLHERQESMLDEAREYLQLARNTGDPEAIARGLHSLSYSLLRHGRPGEAMSLAEEACRIHQGRRDRISELISLQHLGWVLLADGRYDRAKAMMLQTLSIQKEVERKQELMTALQALADIAMHEERWEYALCLYGITEAMIETQKLITAEGRKAGTEEQLAKLRGILDERTFDRIWSKGSSLSVEQAIEFVLSGATMGTVS